MAELQNPDPLVEAVAKARAAVSQRPDIKFPTGNLNRIGRHFYAYSGSSPTGGSAGTEHTMLEFTTANFYILGHWQEFYNMDNEGDDVEFLVYLNNILIDGLLLTHSQALDDTTSRQLLIPPNTLATFTGQNISGSGARPLFLTFMGEVYEP